MCETVVAGGGLEPSTSTFRELRPAAERPGFNPLRASRLTARSIWLGGADSNCRSGLQRPASWPLNDLPLNGVDRKTPQKLVGDLGFEPRFSWSQAKRVNPFPWSPKYKTTIRRAGTKRAASGSETCARRVHLWGDRRESNPRGQIHSLPPKSLGHGHAWCQEHESNVLVRLFRPAP